MLRRTRDLTIIASIFVVVLGAATVSTARAHLLFGSSLRTLDQPDAAKVTVLYALRGGNDGAQPMGGLVADKKGALYGVTPNGGSAACNASSGCGVAFKLSPQAGGGYRETVIYRFLGHGDGVMPEGALVIDSNGALYGTALKGGKFGLGAAFKLTPTQSGYKETLIYSFGNYDPTFPVAGLTAGPNGVLFGTGEYGGAYSSGGVYKLTPSGDSYKETTLYSFEGTNGSGTDAAQPFAPVIIDRSGNLYGTTYSGGGPQCGAGCGTVYKLTVSGQQYTESILYRFQEKADGGQPQAGLTAGADGRFFGTTTVGTVYELTPSHSGFAFKVIHTFKNKYDGVDPVSGVVIGKGGILYGGLWGGGVNCDASLGCGTLYSLAPAAGGYHLTVLHRFQSGADGAHPYATPIIDSAGALLGTTYGGGPKSAGTVYKAVL